MLSAFLAEKRLFCGLFTIIKKMFDDICQLVLFENYLLLSLCFAYFSFALLLL